MNELKIRAWDNINGVMVRDFGSGPENKLITPKGTYTYGVTASEGQIKAVMSLRGPKDLSYTFIQKMPLMTSIGIIDKKGEEVFIGDIVDCFREELRIVERCAGSLGLRGTISREFTSFSDVYGFVEVIGNIYETPNLLHKQKSSAF